MTRGRAGRLARELDYAVVDVETTGLEPGSGAKVCEIAVVRMRGDGTVLREFTTLVDPRIPVTGQEFHGIADGDVVGAPTAGDIVGELTELFSGAVLVGHNLDFEERFLTADFVPLGLPADMPGLCTLRTLRAQIDLKRYSLPRASHALNGHWPTGQHTALGDARACAQLLAELLCNAPGELRYVGPQPVELPGRSEGARLKPRRRVDGVEQRLADGVARQAPVQALSRWPSLWRPLELDPRMCGGRFDEEERAAAVAAARERRRRSHRASATAALTGALATAAAVAALTRRLRAY
ncbi:3'-5' exonuclease [Marinactinospora thermotolerans]|uniref:3'-5' exonuclease n=1 Tax=Marinactinospora thermotolerans TaxID=531310 RepID=UPI002E10A6F3